MNYWHAAVIEQCEVIDMVEPCTLYPTPCPEDHFIVISAAQWNDVGFLLDRIGVLASRIEYVEMPPCE